MPIRPENRARYPAGWREISERIRFERALSQCECEGECGRGTHQGRCPNVHGYPAYGTESNVVLTVAHLDHTPENCADSNLKAMCQGCHLHYDREHHAQTAYDTRREGLVVSDLFPAECNCAARTYHPENNIGKFCWRSGFDIRDSDFTDAVTASEE